ncbi:hyaluronidase-like [Agrilus planipennis]|uniref:Hyaluronidase n=1 Tax=Agrilus planipennis TaxID=224129 RepID=A0A1W4X9T2_AGRPL|nr:hyaluronidase-like [Agrilus planipennis]
MCLCSKIYLIALVAVSVAIESNKIPSVTTFPVYWNVPTFQCDSHKINFTTLAIKYGIIQNENDRFRGSKLAILYDPGAFPAILKAKDSSKTVLRNGGIPQRGNLTFHLDLFNETVNNLIEDVDFKGLGIIDFESWRPIFRQNFGTLTPYQDLSVNELKKLHPFWPDKILKQQAAREFELAAKTFMLETLLLANRLRPNATWGYYHYPYCFNMSPANSRTNCPQHVVMENNKISPWLFRNSDNLHPSIYMSENYLNVTEKVRMVVGRVKESQRILTSMDSKKPSGIYPYFWYKYQDTRNFVGKEDLYEILKVLGTLDINGLILWGSSSDVNSRNNCQELYKYIEFVLGPAILDKCTGETANLQGAMCQIRNPERKCSFLYLYNNCFPQRVQ